MSRALQKQIERSRQAQNGCKRVEVILTASQSLKLDLLASEAGKPKASIIAGLIEGAK